MWVFGALLCMSSASRDFLWACCTELMLLCARATFGWPQPYAAMQVASACCGMLGASVCCPHVVFGIGARLVVLANYLAPNLERLAKVLERLCLLAHVTRHTVKVSPDVFGIWKRPHTS